MFVVCIDENRNSTSRAPRTGFLPYLGFRSKNASLEKHPISCQNQSARAAPDLAKIGRRAYKARDKRDPESRSKLAVISVY